MSCHVMLGHVMPCHVIEKRDTLSSDQRMSLSPLYREEGDTLSCVDIRIHSLSFLNREWHSLLCIEKEHASSTYRRETHSLF